MRNFIKNLGKKIAQKQKQQHIETIKQAGTSFEVGTSKTVLSSTETLTINTKTLKMINEVKEGMTALFQSSENNPEKLLNYISAQGTKVVRLNNANNLLNKIQEHTGFITELEGFKALYLNFITGNGLKLHSEPVFVISANKQIEYFMLLRETYLWYSMKKGLPGFDFNTQEKFKKYLRNFDVKDDKKLKIKEIFDIKEAVKRDKEANEFTMSLAQESEFSLKTNNTPNP